jgi:hypothetical protein
MKMCNIWVCSVCVCTWMISCAKWMSWLDSPAFICLERASSITTGLWKYQLLLLAQFTTPHTVAKQFKAWIQTHRA